MKPVLWLVFAFVGIVASILAPIVSRYASLAPNEAFSVSTKVPYTLNPPAHLFRNRMGHWKSPADRSLIQWWNYAVVDAETGMSWTIAFGLTESKKSAPGKKAAASADTPNSPQLIVSSVFIAQRLGAEMVLEVSDFGILNSSTVVTNACDVTFYHPKTRAVLHTQVVSEDGSTYKVQAKLEGVSFDLTFHRIHGIYFGEDDDPKVVETCSPTSTFYGYHSTVEGTVSTDTSKFVFDTSPRYRAYAGSTWGCYLPFGNPPVDYPWTWVWLVIPRDNNPQNDIALTVGTVRYAEYPMAPGLLKGFFGDVLVLDIGDEHHHLSSVRLLHNTSFDFRMVASVSAADKYFVSSSLKVSDWYTLTDRFGSSRLPLVQEYEYVSHTMKVSLIVTAKPGEHFRIAMSRDGNMYSDFRANGIDVYAKIVRLSPSGEVTETIFDGLASSRFSAVEYAYADPYPTSPEHLEELSQNALNRLTSPDFQ